MCWEYAAGVKRAAGGDGNEETTTNTITNARAAAFDRTNANHLAPINLLPTTTSGDNANVGKLSFNSIHV